jgi:carbohydrate kinase (thermoresistant glucokinase family)
MASAPDASSEALIILLMGVAGCGKTTVGHRLAAALGVPFVDADDLHPALNVRKMRAGTPLTDADRAPWLEAVGREIADAAAGPRGLVVACSALKRCYRDRLRWAAPALRLVWLTGPSPLMRDRLNARTGHFMPPALLDSQLETLEPPTPDERPIVADIAQSPADIVAVIRRRLAAEP